MRVNCQRRLFTGLCQFVVVCTVFAGCRSQPLVPPDSNLPVELNKASLPPYVIEPPDILMVDAIRVIARPPYHIEPLDLLLISVQNVAPDPIEGIFPVSPD